MKKILFTLVLTITTFVCNAQIFNTIKYLDKFDDVIKKEKVKTLITETEFTWEFETKGRTPKIYYFLKTVENSCIGDSEENNHERLVGNVFGYQETYLVSDVPIIQGISIEKNKNLKGDNLLILTHRVISKWDFEFEYDCEYFWITKGDGSRIIFLNE